MNPIRDAFVSTHNGFSADRVLVDPELNAAFLPECRKRGLDYEPRDLNRYLLNARKKSILQGVRTTQETSFPDLPDYFHPAQVAARFLERSDGLSLDRILCDPVLSARFDAHAAELSREPSVLKCRWAALYLRKNRRLRPELIAHIVRPSAMSMGPADQVVIAELSDGPGLYAFHTQGQTLYVGEASNLRRRLAKHLDHSDNKSLAHWFWEHGIAEVQLELRHLPDSVDLRTRRALEAELIISSGAVFNIQGKATAS